MNDLPRIYRNYELLFTPHLIPQLRNLRGTEWAKLIDYLTKLPHTHPDALGFSMMMIQLGGCLPCEMGNYRAQRGCATCARQTVISYKDSDTQLLKHYEQARELVHQLISQNELEQAA